MKRYPVYKDSGIEWLGDIPAHWKIIRLKYVAKIQTGITLGKKYQNLALETKPYLRVANVQDGYLDLSEIKTIDLPKSDAEKSILQKGDVLMTEGGDFDKLGRGYVWEGQIENCLHQNHIFAVKPNKNYLNSYFLAALLISSPGKNYFIYTSKQTTNLASTNSSILKKLDVLLPDLIEQNQILEFINHKLAQIDQFICYKRRLIELLNEQKTALINRAVTKGLNPDVSMKPSGSRFYPSIPAHWEMVKLGYLCNKIADGPHFSPKYVDRGIMFLSARNIKVDSWYLEDAKYISEDDYREFCKRIIPEKGDILYTKGGTTGVARVVDLEQPFQVWVHVAVLKLRKDKINSYLLSSILNSNSCYEQSQLYTRGATNNDLGLTRMINIELAIPPSAEEQNKILDYINSESSKIDQAIAQAEKEIELIQEYRTTLISDAVTGKIDVRDTLERGAALVAGGV